MKKLSLALMLTLGLSACSMNDNQIREYYSHRYSQDDEYVSQFANEIKGLSVEQLAVIGAQKEKAKMNGKKRLQISHHLFVENVRAKDNKVIFEYSFDQVWWERLLTYQKESLQDAMQKDLIYRTCSLKTVALAQEKGLEERHQYFYNYQNKLLAFELKASKEICLTNGFRN